MTQTITWTEKKVKVTDLIPADYNPRKINAKEREDLTRSIEQFGRVEPVVVNTGSRKNCVIGGHQRLKIYADLGITEVEAKVPSRELTEDEEKELNLRLNKNVGSWDEELLKAMDLTMLLDVGFGDEELQGIFDDVDVIEDDYDVEKALRETVTPKVAVGEIWQLGNHKLLVGDSTDETQVKLLMGDEKADIIYCDPPYNIGLDYAKGIGNTDKYGGEYSSKDDSKSDTEYATFIEKSITIATAIAKPNAHIFYWCDSKYIWLLQTLYGKHKVDSKRVCLWLKNNGNPTPKIAFNKVYEPCVYGVLGKPHLNKGVQNGNEILNQEVGTGNQVHEDVLEMIDIWLDKRDNTKEYLHPTQKPVTLNEKPLKRCSAPGHVVFSGFGGSGSDLIACEILQRKWRGVEQDPIFATIIIDRWEKFTNLKATRIYGNS
jgi:DNA modification methylase